jgi:enoyl-CoA hydratase/carnithine racemase
MAGFKAILYEKDRGVAHISLNRPEVLNAYNMQMRDDFSEALGAVQEDSEVGVLLISGQGRAFCAGADLTEFGTAPSQVIARQVRWERDVWGQLYGLNKPVVAALHGYCIGSGLEIALMCDLCVAAKSTWFAMPEVQLGMIPAAGGTQTLPRHARVSQALDVLLTGHRFYAEEALRFRLVTRVVPDDELLDTAWGICRQLADLAPELVTAAKTALRGAWDLNLEEGLALESRLAVLSMERKREQ